MKDDAVVCPECWAYIPMRHKDDHVRWHDELHDAIRRAGADRVTRML